MAAYQTHPNSYVVLVLFTTSLMLNTTYWVLQTVASRMEKLNIMVI